MTGTNTDLESISVPESSHGKTGARNSLSSGSRSSHSSLGTEKSDKEDATGPGTVGGPKTSKSIRGRPSACVFVASLSSNKLDEELSISVTKLFKKWGAISAVKVLRDTSNRPYAFVQYSNETDCLRAIREGHNTLLHGRKIRCEAAKVNRTIYISSSNYMTEEVMSEKLGTYGEIEDLVATNNTGDLFYTQTKSMGSKAWYCKFAYRDDAIGAFASLAEEDVFKVEWAQNIETEEVRHSRYEDDDEIGGVAKVKFDKFSIFVGQLLDHITEKDLHLRFSAHGTIDNIDVIHKQKGTFAFIFYMEEASAARAVERENHSVFRGRTMHVQYREVHYMRQQCNTSKTGLVLAAPPINFNKRKVITYGNKTSPRPKEKLYPLKNKFTGLASNRYYTGDYRKKSTSSEGIDKENIVIEEPRSKYEKHGVFSDTVGEHMDPNALQFTPQVPYFYYIPNSEMPVGNNFLPPSSARVPPMPHPNYFYQQYYLPYENHEYHSQPPMYPYPMYYPSDEYGKNEKNRM